MINGVYVSVIEEDVWVMALGIRDALPADGACVGYVGCLCRDTRWLC